MWPPFFFGVIPTYGVLPYAMIYVEDFYCVAVIRSLRQSVAGSDYGSEQIIQTVSRS